MNLANALTLLRIAAVPLFVLLWLEKMSVTAGLILALAFLTDFLDGQVARARNECTLLGAILDPVADKFLVLTLVGLLTYEKILPFWYLTVVSVRNTSQLMAIPVLIGWKKIHFKVRPRMLPKSATAICFAIIGLGFLYHQSNYLALMLSAILEIYIFATFLPRLVEIYQGKHDTFE